MRSFDQFIEHLASVGFDPETIIDAGVAWGTPALYKNFPKAYLYLIEAVPYFEPHLQNILRKRPGQYILKGVADHAERKTIRVRKEAMALAGTNILEGGKAGDLEFEIEIDTIDNIVDFEATRAPCLLKLDVQGADLRALKGATGTLEKVEVVIAEASLFNENNLAFDIMAFMRERGFVLYDMVGAAYRPYDKALGQIDLAFVAETSGLIAHKKWA